MPRRQLRPLLLALLLLAVVATAVFGVSGGLASSPRSSAPASATSKHQPNAPAETIQQCLKTLASIQAAVNRLRKLRQDVVAKRTYLYTIAHLGDSNVFLPVSVDEFTHFLTIELAAGGISSRQLLRLVREIRQMTAENLRHLEKYISAENADAQSQKKHCDALRRGTTPPKPPAPPPPAAELKLTISFGGATETRDLKTGAATPPPHSPGATAHLQSGPTEYSGTVTVTGTLPAGYTVYVAFHGRVWADLGPTGGGFSGIKEAKGFGAANDIGAYACKPPGAKKGDPVPSSCLEGAVIDIVWSP